MGFYQLHKTQKIPASVEKVWDFIVVSDKSEFRKKLCNNSAFWGMLIRR